MCGIETRRLLAGAGLVGLLFWMAPVYAQQPPPEKPKAEAAAAVKAPVLSTEQKQAIQLVAQRLENAQLRAQLAAKDYDQARSDLTQLVQSLQVPGYDLDLQQLTYVKKAEPPKAPETKKEK